MLGLVAESDEPSLSSGVSASNGRGYAICHEVQRAFLESFDVNRDGSCGVDDLSVTETLLGPGGKIPVTEIEVERQRLRSSLPEHARR